MSVGIGMFSTLSRHLTNRQIHAHFAVAVPPRGSYWSVEPPQAVERTIELLAAGQLGVFARRQALELGATRHVIAGRVASGAWPLVLPSVHRVAAVPRTRKQAAMAAALWCAPDGLVSRETAGQLWGFEGITTDEVHVTVLANRRLRSEDVIVHRVADLLPADIGRRGPIAVTSPLRTAIDLAGVVTADALEIAIESALRRRLFSVGQLRWRAEALMGTGRAGSAALRDLIARRDLGRTESRWEVRTAQVLVSRGVRSADAAVLRTSPRHRDRQG